MTSYCFVKTTAWRSVFSSVPLKAILTLTIILLRAAYIYINTSKPPWISTDYLDRRCHRVCRVWGAIYFKRVLYSPKQLNIYIWICNAKSHLLNIHIYKKKTFYIFIFNMDSTSQLPYHRPRPVLAAKATIFRV